MKSLFTVNRVNILADGLGISVRELCRRSGIVRFQDIGK